MALEEIFRAYDVRGRVPDDLDTDVMTRIGQAAGTELRERGEDTVVVGRDARVSSPDLLEAFATGAMAAGVDVKDAGLVPYGAALFTGWRRSLPTAYVTASHLTKEWNGVKFTHGSGVGFVAEENAVIEDRFFDEAFAAGDGVREAVDVLDTYQDYLTDRVHVDDLRVLVDPGNGATAVTAPDVVRGAGATVEALHDEPDGTFPNRESDVTAASLEAARDRVRDEGFDCGLAFDGDGDRVAVIDDTGRLLSAEEVAAVILQHLLPGEAGPVVANVECSRLVEEVAEEYGRDVHRIRVGHNYMVREAQQEDAVIGLETARHMVVPSLLPVDDGIAAGLAALEAIDALDRPVSAVVDALPTYHRDRLAFDVPDEEKFDLVARLQERFSEEYERTNTIDGVRVDLEEGWVLIRASNTSPVVRLIVEAEDEAAFERLKAEFTGVLEDAIADS